MLLPALAKAKTKAQGIQCMNLTRQMTLGSIMYSSDNNDRICQNINGVNYKGLGSDLPMGWVRNWENFVPNNAGNYDPAGILTGLLAPYVANNVNTYKCPADNYMCVKPGQQVPRLRSFSMNAYLGSSAADVSYANTYQLWTKLGAITRPADIFMFVDENPDSINDGFMLIGPSSAQNWVNDWPAAYHNGACGFSFSDGHSAIQKWRGPTATYKVKAQGESLNSSPWFGGTEMTWAFEHATRPR